MLVKGILPHLWIFTRGQNRLKTMHQFYYTYNRLTEAGFPPYRQTRDQVWFQQSENGSNQQSVLTKIVVIVVQEIETQGRLDVPA